MLYLVRVNKAMLAEGIWCPGEAGNKVAPERKLLVENLKRMTFIYGSRVRRRVRGGDAK
jgi:hypothetical protein